MTAAARNAEPVVLLEAVLTIALDSHPSVATQGVMYAEKCLARLKVGDVPGNGLADGLDMRALILAVAKGAGSRDSDAKEAAWRAVERQV